MDNFNNEIGKVKTFFTSNYEALKAKFGKQAIIKASICAGVIYITTHSIIGTVAAFTSFLFLNNTKTVI